jgi:hypothetical protein
MPIYSRNVDDVARIICEALVIGEKMPDFDKLLIAPKPVDTSVGPGRYCKINSTHSQPSFLELDDTL